MVVFQFPQGDVENDTRKGRQILKSPVSRSARFDEAAPAGWCSTGTGIRGLPPDSGQRQPFVSSVQTGTGGRFQSRSVGQLVLW